MTRGIACLFAIAIVASLLTAWRATTFIQSSELVVGPLPPFAASSMTSLPSAAQKPQVPPISRPVFSQHMMNTAAADEELAPVTTGALPTVPRLIGIILDGDRRIAVISYEGKILRIFEDTQLGDWTVTKIEQRSALLQKQSGTQLLMLDGKPAQ